MADIPEKKNQRHRQNSRRMFGERVDIEDDPADREKRHHPPESQLSVRPLHRRIQLLRQNRLMKSASGRLDGRQPRQHARECSQLYKRVLPS